MPDVSSKIPVEFQKRIRDSIFRSIAFPWISCDYVFNQQTRAALLLGFLTVTRGLRSARRVRVCGSARPLVIRTFNLRLGCVGSWLNVGERTTYPAPRQKQFAA